MLIIPFEVLRLADETILTGSDKNYTQYQRASDGVGLVRLVKKDEKPDIVVDKKTIFGLTLKLPLKKVSKQEALVESNNFSKIYVNTDYGVLRSVRPGESVDVYVSKKLSDGSSILCPAKKIKTAEDDLFADKKFFEKVDGNIRLEIKERLEKSLHVLAQSRLIRRILALAICAKNIVVASGVHHFELNWGDQDKEFAACVSESGTNRCTSLFINHSKCDSIISLRLPMLRKDVDIENLIVIFHEFKHLIFNALFGDITINFNSEWSDANELGANLNFIRTLIGESRDENLSSDDVIELFSSIFSGDNGQYDQIEMEQIIGLFSFTNNNEKEDGKCKNSVIFDTLNDFFIQKEVCSILAKTEYTHINENAICLRSSRDQPRARLSDVMTLYITNALPRLKVFFSDLAEEITQKKIKMSEEEDESDDSLEVYGLAVERISRFLNTIENLRDIFEVTPGEIYQKGEEQGKKDNRSPEEVIMNIRKILYWVVDIGVTWSPELTRFYSELELIRRK